MLDAEGNVTQGNIKVTDLCSSNKDLRRVLTRWNSEGQPVGEAAGLLGGFLGLAAKNFTHFPMMYETWHKVPPTYKNNYYDSTIKVSIIIV